MNGYLVVLSHTCDDFPLSLHATKEEAEEVARKVSWYAPDSHPFNRDAATPINVGILRFVDGEPISHEIIRDVDLGDYEDDYTYDSETEFE